MLPVIAIVGRPNVGKSTLFNCLTRSRNALVAELAGLTRDRQYGQAVINERQCLVIDTGGFTYACEGMDSMIDTQAEQALQEADIVLFVVDAKAGLHPDDAAIAKRLRQLNKPCFLLVNKVDGQDSDIACGDFYSLGMGQPLAIAAAHRRGLDELADTIVDAIPEAIEAEIEEDNDAIRIAIVGRPNVGKSTLVNRLLGEDRVLVYDEPGTTRDSIFVPLTRDDKQYILIDTAGVRRKHKQGEAVENFSVAKTMQAVKLANVVVFVIDARTNIVDQDLHLLGFVLEAGKSLVLAVNKWDGMHHSDRQQVQYELDRRLSFIDFAKPLTISALHGTGVGDLFKHINKAYQSAMCELNTALLNKILEQAVAEHQPPLVQGRRVRLRYAHAGGHNPPTIVIHGKQTAKLPNAYVRYLANTYRKALKLTGTPVHIQLRTDDNPFAGRKNKLTDSQIRKRKRMMRHVKKKKT